jgi:hypothetical protein
MRGQTTTMTISRITNLKGTPTSAFERAGRNNDSGDNMGHELCKPTQLTSGYALPGLPAFTVTQVMCYCL